MRASSYTREQLLAMPIAVLRNVDIHDKSEEDLVQEILNSKLGTAPIQDVVINKYSDKTDFKTGEEEKEFQKIIDERMAKARHQLKVDEAIVKPSPEVVAVLEETEQVLSKKIAKIKKAKKKLE